MDSNGLDPEQQALLASIMGKSPQAGGGAAFSAAQVTSASVSPAAPSGAAAGTGSAAEPAKGSGTPGAAPIPDNGGRMLSQREIDALIASMLQQ